MRSLKRVLDGDLISLAAYAGLPEAVAHALRIERADSVDDRTKALVEPLREVVDPGGRFTESHYSGVVINLYGLVERFLEELVVEAVDAIASVSPSWASLPEAIQKQHTPLSIDLIRSLESSQPSQSHDLQQAVETLGLSLSRSGDIALNSRSFARHTANFRHDTTVQMLSQIGVNCGHLKDSYWAACVEDDLQPLPDWKHPVVDELAYRRNLVAHGRVDSLMSPELLVTMIELVRVYLAQVAEAVLDSVARHTIAVGEGISLGRPDKVWQQGKVLGFREAGCDLKVGDHLASVPSQGISQVLKVVSLQSDGIDIESTQGKDPCGVGVDRPTPGRRRLWRLPRNTRFWV